MNVSWNERWLMILFLCFLAAVHGIIALVLKGFITWYGDITNREALNRKNFEVELALVKAQINPHFLFNTINNIDVLIEKDPAKASLYLNKLSDIMRFMLYETKTDLIPLNKELDYINKYIGLQKIRTVNNDFVKFDLSGEPGNHMIAPMLFISYIENAFKHAEIRKNESAIDIRITITDKMLHFFCENKFTSNPAIKKDHNGLGNSLLVKRLDLLYPGRYKLLINELNSKYTVQLTINNLYV